jgi:hypothetical protein
MLFPNMVCLTVPLTSSSWKLNNNKNILKTKFGKKTKTGAKSRGTEFGYLGLFQNNEGQLKVISGLAVRPVKGWPPAGPSGWG